MTREDVAKAYIQSAQGRAARAGVIAFGAGLALVVLWAVELQDRTSGLLQALAEKPVYSNLSRQRAAVAGNNAVSVQQLNAAQKGSKRSARISQYVEELKDEASRLGKQARSIEQRTETATTVTFRFPGLPEIKVRDTSAAFVWLACAAVLLQYLAWCRRSVLILYSRALRILVSEANVDPAVLHDIAGPLPFWIAPLPHGDGRYVSVNLLRSAIGWDQTSGRNYFLLGFIQFAAGLIVLHVVYLGVVFSQVAVQASRSASLLRNTPVLPITIIVGLAFAAIVLWWLRPGHVPDSYSFEPKPSSPPSRGRRALILAAAGSVAAAISLVVVSPATMRKLILRPRFRRWTNRSALAMGFYEVGRAKRVHHVAGKGRPKTLKSVPDRQIRQVEIDKDQLHRLHPSAVDAWTSAATVSFKMTAHDIAKEGMEHVLSSAKGGQRPSLTWFERFAEEARSAGNAEEIERVIQSLDALAATTGGQQIKEQIERRRGFWNARVAQLNRSRQA